MKKRKNLKDKIDENKGKIRQYKAKIKEHIDYKDIIKKIFSAKSLKTAMKYYHQLHDTLDELLTIIQES